MSGRQGSGVRRELTLMQECARVGKKESTLKVCKKERVNSKSVQECKSEL